MPTLPKKEKQRPWITRKEEEKKPWSKNPEEQQIYRSAEWRKLREIKLENDPYCEECKRKGIRTWAIIVDHIIPIRKGGDPWDENNLQSLCVECHNSKTARESNE